MATFMSYYNLLIEWYSTFTKEFVHIDKLWDTFDQLETIENYDVGQEFKFKKGNFELNNLFFSYSSTVPIIENLSLKIV